MKTYLVTGAAGFIGANYLKYILKKYDDVRVVALDLLTYAGYLGTIAEDIDDERCFFVRGDIGDRKLVDELFATYHFDVVVNFAAESHVDRSIENPANKYSRYAEFAGLCAPRLGDRQGRTGLPDVENRRSLPPSFDGRGLWQSGRYRILYGRYAAPTPQPLFCVEDECGLGGLRLSRHVSYARQHHALLKQLWTVSISGETHSARDQ